MNTNELKEWFVREQRDLPWRTDRSPYAVWVSEIMLQQTQVAVVIPYFERWMKQFPTIKHLAEASPESVIKAWEGLGYYSRARNLHDGAKYVLNNHNGILPNTYDELKKIKGLGPYTIGAIQSFAFQLRAPAVDGNVIRVLARHFAIKEDISLPKTLSAIKSHAEKLLPQHEPWLFNEALIELGATICTKKPKCQMCPIKNSCKAFAYEITSTLPLKAKKVKTTYLHRAVAIISFKDKILIKKCPKGEIMSDLHEFPYFEIEDKELNLKKIEKSILSSLNSKVTFEKSLSAVTQTFTRYKACLQPLTFKCHERKIPAIQTPFLWASLDQLRELPFSSGHKKILKLFLSD